MSNINFIKDKDDRKEAPELVIEITFEDKSYHQISYFSIDEYNKEGTLISRQINVCSNTEFMELVNKYKIE